MMRERTIHAERATASTTGDSTRRGESPRARLRRSSFALTVVWAVRAVGAGLWLGLAGRVAMRLIAVDANLSPGFSVGGSLEVIAFGLFVGAPLALAFWACRTTLPLPRGSGIVVGLLAFAVLAVAHPPAAASALAATPDSDVITALLFAAVFASYGVVLDVLWRLSE